MRIGLIGFYGDGNFGDELLFENMYRELCVLGVDVTPFSLNRGHTLARHGVDAIDGSLRALFNWNTLKTVKRLDGLLFGGGGLIHDYWGLRGLRWFVGWMCLAHLVRVPIALYGVGAGPIRKRVSGAFIRVACNCSKVITVRDLESAQLLRKIGVRVPISVSGDPGFLWTSTDRGDDPRSDDGTTAGDHVPRILVSVREWVHLARSDSYIKVTQVGADLERQLAALWTEGHSRGIEVRFVALHKDDLSVVERLRSRLGEKASVAADLVETPQALYDLLKGSQLLVGMRFHSLVMAGITGTPMVGIAYDPKITHLMKALGLQRYLVTLESGAPDLSKFVNEALVEQESIKRVIDRGRNVIRKHLVEELRDVARRLV